MPTPPRPTRITSAMAKSQTLEAVSDPVLNTVQDRASRTLSPGDTRSGLSTVDALQEMGSSRLDSRTSMMRSQLFFSVFRYLPYPLIMVLPFLREDSKQLIRHWRQRRSRQKSTAAADALIPDGDAEVSSQDQVQAQPSPYKRYRCVEHPLNCSQLNQAPE